MSEGSCPRCLGSGRLRSKRDVYIVAVAFVIYVSAGFVLRQFEWRLGPSIPPIRLMLVGLISVVGFVSLFVFLVGLISFCRGRCSFCKGEGCIETIPPPRPFLWKEDRARLQAEGCRRCGYDLTGNVSGRCPECGIECLEV